MLQNLESYLLIRDLTYQINSTTQVNIRNWGGKKFGSLVQERQNGLSVKPASVESLLVINGLEIWSHS